MKGLFTSCLISILCVIGWTCQFAQADVVLGARQDNGWFNVSGNDETAEDLKTLFVCRSHAEDAFRHGQYRDALKFYTNLLKMPENPPEEAADDFLKAYMCVQKLRRGDGRDRIDCHAEETMLSIVAWEGREDDWRFAACVHELFRKNGLFLLSYFNEYERMKSRMERLRTMLPYKGENRMRAKFYEEWSQMLKKWSDSGIGGKYFFMLDNDDDYEYVETTHYKSGGLDSKGNPRKITLPNAFEMAETVGEKWLWCRTRLAECIVADEKADVIYETAKNLYLCLGEQEAMKGKQFWTYNGRLPEQPFLEMLTGLKDNETLFRYEKDDFRKVELPECVDFMKMLKGIAEDGHANAMLLLGMIYANRRQTHAAHQWYSKAKDAFGGETSPLLKKLEHDLKDPMLSFNPMPYVMEGIPSKQDFICRNVEKVRFRLNRLNNDQMIVYLTKLLERYYMGDEWCCIQEEIMEGKMVAIADYLPFQKLPDECLEAALNEWQRVVAAVGHEDVICYEKIPPLNSGFYRLTATLDDGTEVVKDLLCSNTHIVQYHYCSVPTFRLLDVASGAALSGLPVKAIILKWLRNRRGESKTDSVRTITLSSDKEGFIRLQEGDFWPNGEEDDEYDDDDSKYVYNHSDYFLVVNDGHRFAVSGRLCPDFEDTAKNSFRDITSFAVSDRPFYRPGEKVDYAVWISDMKSLMPYADGEVTVCLVCPDVPNDKAKFKLITDRTGAACGSFVLPENASFGDYLITVDSPGKEEWLVHNSDALTFTVGEYRKPETRLSIILPNGPLAPGDSFDVNLHADYVFGRPVGGEKVECRISFYESSQSENKKCCDDEDDAEEEDIMDGGDDDDDDDRLMSRNHGKYMPSWYDGWRKIHFDRKYFPDRMKNEQWEKNVVLDDNGRGNIHIDTSELVEKYGHRVFACDIAAKMTDSSGEEIKDKASFVLDDNSICMNVSSDGIYAIVGQSFSMNVKATSLLKKPIEAKGSLRLMKVNCNNGDITEEEHLVKDFETDALGEALVTVVPKEAGHYRVVAEMMTKAGVWCRNSSMILAWNDGADFRKERFNGLELHLDKSEYRVGETARLLVCNDVADRPVFIRMDGVGGDRCMQMKTIRLAGKCAMLEIPVTAEMVKSVDIVASTLDFVTCSDAGIRLNVVKNAPLKVNVMSKKHEVHPGDTAEVSVLVTDAFGKPVKGKVVMAVYDRSLDWLRKRPRVTLHSAMNRLLQSQNIVYRKVFSVLTTFWHVWKTGNYSVLGFPLFLFTPREKSVIDQWLALYQKIHDPFHAPFHVGKVIDSLSTHRALRKGMADLQLESSEIQWRRDFHDSAFWKSGLETDEDGKVSVAFNLPDNATTWTIRAWAATEDFHYGEGRGSIVAVKDKVIRPLLPKFLVEGDEIDMGIIVHNFTENGLQADANVSFDKRLLRSGPFAQEVTVSPKSMQRILWNVKAVEHGESAMKFSAIGDGIEIRIPVLPMAAAKGKCINTIFSKNGEFREWQFDIGENMLPGSVQFLFDDGTGLIGCVEAARHYLDKYEYTCTEQLASRICGLLETRQDGVELSQHERKKVEKALQFLEKRQFYDGSWPWFQGRGNIVFTCLAVRALIIADRHGFAFDKNMLENGVNYLLKYAKAKAIDSFESAEKGADGDDDEDYDDEDDMMQAIMKTIMPFDAYVAENLILGNPQNEPLPKKVHAFINRIYDARAMLPVHSLSVLCRLLHRLDDKRWMHVQELFDQYIYRNPDQWTAHISMGPESSNDFFDSMISTNAEFLRTMCETGICSTLKPRLVNYLLFNQMSDYSFDGTYGTSTVLRAFAPLMKDEAFKNSGTIDWELDGLPWTPQTSVGAGPHVLRAVKRGAGTAFASARLSWLEKDMQRIPLQSEQVSVSRSFQPLNGDGKTLRAGDMVRVIITLRLLNRMSYLRLSDPLLAGCIPSSQSLSFSGEYYREMHEKTTEFFIHELQPGEHTFSYMLLATHSGRFTALPTLVEPMYAPQFRAVGTAKKIIILPRR